MEYQKDKFTVGGIPSEKYRENFDKVFGGGSVNDADDAHQGEFADGPKRSVAPPEPDSSEQRAKVTHLPPLLAPLFCPFCQKRHVDRGVWAEKPHHNHLCEFCAGPWRVEPYVFGSEE